MIRSDYLTPCSAGESGAIEMNWMDINPDLLFEPYVTMQVKARVELKGKLLKQYLSHCSL